MASNSSIYYRFRGYRKRRRKDAGGPRWLVALVALGVLGIAALGVGAGVTYGIYRNYSDEFVPPDQYIDGLSKGGVRYFDKNGVLLREVLADRQREPVPLQEISYPLVAATVAAEDASFWDNPGVNTKGLMRAVWENLPVVSGDPDFLQGSGGSSITQQLVKNVYFTDDERAERSIERKLKETAFALIITEDYSKSQILEWYLNLIPYGKQFYGVQAAARGYFDKDARDLSLAESALLAAIPRSPKAYDPVVNPEAARAQRNIVLWRMHEEGYIDAETALRTAVQPLELNPGRYGDIKAPHFVLYVVEPQLEAMFGSEALQQDGLVVTTTIDLELQERAQAILEEKITKYEDTVDGHNGAFVAIDPKTAQILIYIGSRDNNRDDIDGQNDMAGAFNSPGSSFKPIVYLAAMENLGWGPGTVLLDTAVPGEFWDGKKPPTNPDGVLRGPFSVRKSLGNSLNVPAVKTALYVGVGNICAQAESMGYTIRNCENLGPSMAVGGVDLRLIDQVYGYTAFPGLGIQRGVDLPSSSPALDPISILRVEDRDGNVLYPETMPDEDPATDGPPVQEQRVASAASTAMITDILTDPQAHCITYGSCGALTVPGPQPVAIKTGTSEPYENCSACVGETWVLGYTPQIVAGTWFGNADNSPMHGLTSYNVSWETIRDFMIQYHADLPVEQFPMPEEDLVKAKVCMPSGRRPSDDCPKGAITEEDWFAKATLSDEDDEEEEDDWWKTVRIDIRTGLRASDLTPGRYVRASFYLELPEGLSDFERNQAEEWARRFSAATGEVPERETEAGDIPVTITLPAPDAQFDVGAEITIAGRANSANFVSWRIEYRSSPWIEGWTRIDGGDDPVPDGNLGVWNTGGLTQGTYTVRLVVKDERIGEISASVTIHLTGASVPTPARATPTVAPPPATPTPTATPEGGGGG